MIPFFAIVIIFNFFRFHGENNVAPDLLLYYKLLQHVTEDKNKGFYGLGQSAAHALRPFIKQCAHGSSLWNTHEVPGGKHHRLWHQTTWKHGRVRNLYYLIKHCFVGFFWGIKMVEYMFLCYRRFLTVQWTVFQTTCTLICFFKSMFCFFCHFHKSQNI